MAAPLSYDQFMESRRDERLIPFEAFGRTFHIRTPEAMTDDEAVEFLDLIGKDNELSAVDVVRMAELAVDDWPAFSAAGGTAMGLASFMRVLLEQRQAEAEASQGVGLGESGASSAS